MHKRILKTDQNNPTVRAYIDALKKGSNDQHVILIEDKWVVKSLVSKKITKAFSTQKEAAEHAKSIARKSKNSVFIHNKRGIIRERRDY